MVRDHDDESHIFQFCVNYRIYHFIMPTDIPLVPKFPLWHPKLAMILSHDLTLAADLF